MSIFRCVTEKDQHRRYKNRFTWVNGDRFDSKLEAERWVQLKLLEQCFQISELKRQVSYKLEVNGQKIATIRLDYQYRENNQLVVEDAKGVLTKDWLIKAKLFKALYPLIELRTYPEKKI